VGESGRAGRAPRESGAGAAIVAAACAALLLGACALGSGAPSRRIDVPPGSALSESQLDALVAPVALLPDELLALVLPAATEPVQLEQAERYLARYARDASAPPPVALAPAVRALLNYPELVETLRKDPPWTAQLGDAVASQPGAVLSAVQRVRRHARATGSLRSDHALAVGEADEDVLIRSARGREVLVPRYDADAVLGPGPAPIVDYGPARPVYWSPSARFTLGVTPGGPLGFSVDWRDDAIYWGAHRDAVDVGPWSGDARDPAQPATPRDAEVWTPSRPASTPPGGAAGRALDRATSTGAAGMTGPGLVRPTYGGSTPPIPSRPSAAPRPVVSPPSAGGGRR